MEIGEVILVVITTVVLFLQGFYFGKRQIRRLVIVSLVLIVFDLEIVVSNGIYIYSVAMLNADKYEASVAIIYAISWWGLGFIVSHLILVTEKDIGKVKRIKFLSK
jgi:hypothetical protein